MVKHNGLCLTVKPANGRTYILKSELLRDWNANKQFEIVHDKPFLARPHMHKYLSKDDASELQELGYTHLQVVNSRSLELATLEL